MVFIIHCTFLIYNTTYMAMVYKTTVVIGTTLTILTVVVIPNIFFSDIQILIRKHSTFHYTIVKAATFELMSNSDKIKVCKNCIVLINKKQAIMPD